MSEAPPGASANRELARAKRPVVVPASRTEPIEPPQLTWSWEGNVQAAVVAHLAAHGWRVTRVADTASREHGTDVVATGDGRLIHVEVKGWPSDRYMDPARAHETKRTQPVLMARTWFADGLMHVMRLRSANPNDEVVLAMPSMPTYVRLWDGIRPAARAARVSAIWVGDDGSVRVDDAEDLAAEDE